METSLWKEFATLAAGGPRIIATVTAHNADGTSSLTTYEGAEMRAMGQLQSVPPYNVWVQAGRVIEAAPNNPIVHSTV